MYYAAPAHLTRLSANGTGNGKRAALLVPFEIPAHLAWFIFEIPAHLARFSS